MENSTKEIKTLENEKDDNPISSILKELCDIEPKLSTTLDLELIKREFLRSKIDFMNNYECNKLLAETCAFHCTKHPDYAVLAGRIHTNVTHCITPNTFVETAEKCYKFVHPKLGRHTPLYSKELFDLAKKHGEIIEKKIDYKRDYKFDYFGLKVLEKSYLIKTCDEIVERPQHMYMRVSLGLYKEDLENAFENYDNLSEGYYTHATPTLFNAGKPNPQMASCNLLNVGDSIEEIYEALKQMALISKNAGGIGFSFSDVRAKDSYITGSGGNSNGIVPALKVFNDTCRYVDQGGGKRKGAFACYIEPWHPDIFDFLNLKKNNGKEEIRARDLFYALWIPDLFMERVRDGGKWSLFCPHECPGLTNAWGPEFKKLYEKYEFDGKARKCILAQDLWKEIVVSINETGTPFMLFKDACNLKSNQSHFGTIKCSNLCTEIIQYSDHRTGHVAVCNLLSLCLPKYVVNGKFDHQLLYDKTFFATKTSDRVIDLNSYPIPEAEKSNKDFRPLGIGVQGLADVFLMLKIPWDSKEAKQLNREIFETIYFACLSASCHMAICKGRYPLFDGSYFSFGLVQQDLWKSEYKKKCDSFFYKENSRILKGKWDNPVVLSGRWNWNELKNKIKTYGIRNSLLTAVMPTASTSQILGNNECIEPYVSNVFCKRLLSGEVIVLNKWLVLYLEQRGLWNETIRKKLIAHNGSVANIEEIPEDLKELFKTVWEISMRTLIDFSADRGCFIDQSQSLNLFIEEPTYQKITSMLFYSWAKGNKTGMYYLRIRPSADPIKFTVDYELDKQAKESREKKEKNNSCSIGCDSCGA